jgi:two-component system, cell cycle response regulator DivK
MKVRTSNTALIADDNPASAAIPSLRTRAKCTGKSVLIVDDDSDTLRLLEFLMAREGYVVETADGAEGAMALLYSFTPDAVLMDIRLPGMDGLQLSRLIKLTGKANKIPILAVSASDTATTMQEAYEAGCDGYITKPVDTSTFASTVGEYLDRD